MPPPLSMVSAMIHLAGAIQNPANVSFSKSKERNDDTGKRPLQYKRRASGCEHHAYMVLCQEYNILNISGYDILYTYT